MSQSNLEQFKKHLELLIVASDDIHGRFRNFVKHKETQDGFWDLASKYQLWYTEALAVVKQLIPDRLGDFRSQYSSSQKGKNTDLSVYAIEDWFRGIRFTRGPEDGSSLAMQRFTLQADILTSARKRFESSLFEIRQIVAADMFDTEIASARELCRSGFGRAAGAVAGVILEKHLLQVIENRTIKLSKKKPTLNDLIESLKSEGTIDVPTWRGLQRLADIRNICCHGKEDDPSKEQVMELVEGVDKSLKTIF